MPPSSSTSSYTPRVCTIAGSDSGGGAGIQADLKTFLALGAYGLSAVTALTAQNTRGVQAIHYPPADFLRQQLKSIRDDIAVDAWKIGMLGNEEIIEVVAEELQKIRNGRDGPDVPIVLDPVMVSTSGSVLLSDGAIHAMVEKLLPLCSVLTPNLPEVEQIIDHLETLDTQLASNADFADQWSPNWWKTAKGLTSIRSRLDAARYLCRWGPEAVLLKGGHAPIKRSDLERELAELDLNREKAQFQKSKASHRHGEDCLVTGSESSYARSALGRGGVRCLRGDTWPNSKFLESFHRSPHPQSPERDVVMVDVLFDRRSNEHTIFVNGQVDRSCTHGTGCTLSSALAVSLVKDVQATSRKASDLWMATWRSINYVQAAIVRGYEDIGGGPGALDHASSVQRRGVFTSTAESFTEKNAERNESSAPDWGFTSNLGLDTTPFTSRLLSTSLPLWKLYTGHPFVLGLGHPEAFCEPTQSNGNVHTSPSLLKAFTYYIREDYHFLLAFSKVYFLASSLADNFRLAGFFNSLSNSMAAEATSHVELCKMYFGIELEELNRGSQGTAVVAYSSYVLDLARGGGDMVAILTATMPCLLGYADMAWVLEDVMNHTGYRDAAVSQNAAQRGLIVWMESYLSKEYHDTVRAGVALLEWLISKDAPSPRRMEKLSSIWDQAVKLEIALWDECLDKGKEATVL